MRDGLMSLFMPEQRLASLAQFITSVVVEGDNTKFLGLDTSIEGLRSQGYSNFIFGFLVFSLIIFAVIIYLYLPKRKGDLKTGEKIMFGAIIMGMVFAVVFGYIQLIGGYLF